jgi:phospholipid/cholesterol/gamma-HCH transport system ATP-binding protein
MPDSTNILQLDHVTVDESHGYDVGLRDASLSLDSGEMALILLERPNFNIPLADVASGVLFADEGKACFGDRDWSHTLASRAGQQRGQIGRIFAGRSWVSNLDVDENILLPQRHHSSRSEDELRTEAADLAKLFGLSELPTSRPAQTSPQDLLRAACVRAFLGKPKLLLLERPEHGAYPGLVPPLLSAVKSARGKGAAVIWLTNLQEVFDDPQMNPTARYRMQGPSLNRVTES